MRLLNTETGEFQWVEDPRLVHYAILSHVWAKPEDPEGPEQTYQDLLRFQEEARVDPTGRTRPIDMFSDKLRRFCETALKDGFKLGWADTCCIDKTSSSELSEAINSMFSWYGYSGACYAFLRDVNPPSEDPEWRVTFQGSKWFRRGWTLQELIASRVVIFLCRAPSRDGEWEVLGSKHGLAASISSVTNIDIAVLTFEKPLNDIPIARRMAWTQSRETSRLEDEAYCLMGIFGVNMQTNYGEGRYAFIRLQEKILLQNPDQTIFAWGRFLDEPSFTLLPSSSSTVPAVCVSPDLRHNPIAPPSFLKQYLLAPSPKDFDPTRSATMVRLPKEVFQDRLGIPVTEDFYQVFEITAYGLRTHLPLLNVCSSDPHPNAATHCAILACEDPDKGLLALLLRPRRHRTGNEFFAGAIVGPNTQLMLADEPFGHAPVWDHYCRLMYITPEQLVSLRGGKASNFALSRPRIPPSLRISSVYIPHCPSRSAIEQDRDSTIHAVLSEMLESFEVEFCWWSRKVLERDGYRVSRGRKGSQDGPGKPFAGSEAIRPPSFRGENSITISNSSGIYLVIQVGRCSCDFGRRGILGVLVSSRDADSLDGKLSQQDHVMAHPIHVHSWTFDHGSASRQIEFDAPNDARRLSLRLTLTSLAAPPGTTSAVRRYRLGAELREREKSELQNPTQPLPLNSTSSRSLVQRGRSNSSPSRPIRPLPVAAPPSFERGSSRASETSGTTQDSGSYLVDNSHVHTAGLMALGGLLGVALLSLKHYVVR